MIPAAADGDKRRLVPEDLEKMDRAAGEIPDPARPLHLFLRLRCRERQRAVDAERK